MRSIKYKIIILIVVSMLVMMVSLTLLNYLNTSSLLKSNIEKWLFHLTTTNSKDINNLISEVKAESSEAETSMEKGTRQVEAGTKVVEEMGKNNTAIINSINKLADGYKTWSLLPKG